MWTMAQPTADSAVAVDNAKREKKRINFVYLRTHICWIGTRADNETARAPSTEHWCESTHRAKHTRLFSLKTIPHWQRNKPIKLYLFICRRALDSTVFNSWQMNYNYWTLRHNHWIIHVDARQSRQKTSKKNWKRKSIWKKNWWPKTNSIRAADDSNEIHRNGFTFLCTSGGQKPFRWSMCEVCERDNAREETRKKQE